MNKRDEEKAIAADDTAFSKPAPRAAAAAKKRSAKTSITTNTRASDDPFRPAGYKKSGTIYRNTSSDITGMIDLKATRATAVAQARKRTTNDN